MKFLILVIPIGLLPVNIAKSKGKSFILWTIFSFQESSGNLLNIYHWHAVDTKHMIVGRGWYSAKRLEIKIFC